MTTNPQTSRNITVGLSGPSSSGKTTLARLLRSIFNIRPSPSTNNNSITLFILHEDDFYKTDVEIPIITTPSTHRRLQDWDCAAALDLPLLDATLRHISVHGALPSDLESKEDRNEVGDSGVSDSVVESYRQEVISLLREEGIPQQNVKEKAGSSLTTEPNQANSEGGGRVGGEVAMGTGIQIRICILDGFLLYPDPNPNPHPNQSSPSPSIPLSLTALLSPKLFLRSTHALTKRRREARTGYVTLDGFWHDPPGYVDEVVWPNYVRDHAWMFEGGDVDEGEVSDGVGIEVAPGRGERRLEEVLGWAVGVLGGRVAVEMKGGR